MAKKPVTLDGAIDKAARPKSGGAAQRGAGKAPARPRRDATEGDRKLTLTLEEADYRRLKVYAAVNDLTHQHIMHAALMDYLAKVRA